MLEKRDTALLHELLHRMLSCMIACEFCDRLPLPAVMQCMYHNIVTNNMYYNIVTNKSVRVSLIILCEMMFGDVQLNKISK